MPSLELSQDLDSPPSSIIRPWETSEPEPDNPTDSRDIRLLRAARYGWTDIAHTLLQEHRIPINTIRRDGHTPLSLAAKHGHISTVRLLLSHGADPDAKLDDSPPLGGHTALWHAAGENHPEIVTLLLNAGASVNGGEESNPRLYPVSIAAIRGHETVLRILLSAGAQPDCVGVGFADERTPLSYAAEDGAAGIVQLLLEFGADGDRADFAGMTALAYAAQKGEVRTAEILLEHGVDVEAPDNRFSSRAYDPSPGGRTAVSWAAGRGHEAVVRLLLARGADGNSWDLGGKTALVYAARAGHLGTVRILLKHEPNRTLRGPEGLTSLEVALREFKKLDPPVWYEEMWELLEPKITRPQPGFWQRLLD
ncbi:ankyrin repeat-containing domain protein [Aspergillus heterothallicus]